ncbi:hypothetical protein [Saccharothrix sp. ST-888]|uniref:hypothetical protein n=1 Tax=Saccharothrix sp. ST-888 TaxID=1427391 RepID=UPI0005ED2DF0|nr:hypothetical protein [Saccharothrix sp. ST-888]
MYSYDVAAAHRPSATTTRSIPGMRPSYDAEHPSSPTPIYDALYSEYRRLFRALPGDRTGEEDMRFTGFAVRDGYFGRDAHPVREALPPGDSYGTRSEPYGARAELTAYPPQHQTFDTYAGHAQGTPQFMPNQQSGGGQYGTGYLATGPFTPGQVTSGQFSAGQFMTATGQFGAGQPGAGHHATGQPGTGQPSGSGQYAGAAQASGGQGWVASGYLSPAQPVTPGAGTAAGEAGGVSGRHRSMLSLPPGRVPGQS